MAIRDDSKEKAWRPGKAWYQHRPSEMQAHSAKPYVEAFEAAAKELEGTCDELTGFAYQRFLAALRSVK